MFRPTKKRPRKPAIVRTTRDDGDDEDEDDTTVIKRPPRKKTKARPAVMSFQSNDEEEPINKKKKKRKGLGFGGAPVVLPPVLDDKHEAEHGHENEQAINGSEPMTSYGKDALNTLKSQQKYKPRTEENQVADTESMPPPPVATKQQTEVAPSVSDTDTGALPSFIPLSGAKQQAHGMILTGDEALDYETKQQSVPLRTTTEDSILDAEQAEESSAWEAQVASRAGIRPNTRPTKPSSSITATSPTSNTSSMTKLRDQVKSALDQLQLQTQDVQNASARRQVEVTQVQQDLTRQEAELEQAGTALEYYQELRQQLASWVGALRELQQRVKPLQEALHKVERLGGNRWRDWQDDAISILREANLLDKVLGRQPAQEDVQVTTVVDEFGRDVKSQYVLQRDNRVRKRRAIRAQRTIRDDDSDALLSDGEQAEMKTRRDALWEALKFAMDEVDEEYTKLSNLIAFFAIWADKYPEEYKQCFASMSLADLASVLVQADLCSTHHPLRWNDDEELSWLNDLRTIPIGETMEEEDTPSYRMADKVLIPIFLELLDEAAYHMTSSKESRSLAAFYHQIYGMFDNDNTLTRLLSDRVVKYLREGLDNVAIPIIKPDIQSESPSSVDVQEAITYASSGQVRRIEKLLCNLLSNWQLDTMAAPILDFLSSKYLFLLPALPEVNGGKELAEESFQRVMKALQTTGWLERPEFMLQAAPIRAAASVYGLVS